MNNNNHAATQLRSQHSSILQQKLWNKHSYHKHVNMLIYKMQEITRKKLRQAAILNFNHVTIQFMICHFLLMILWNRASVSNGF